MYKLKLHYFVENYVEPERQRFLPTRKKKIFYFLPTLSNTFGSPSAQFIRMAAKRVWLPALKKGMDM